MTGSFSKDKIDMDIEALLQRTQMTILESV
jgi:hypothetical protein